MTLEVSLTHQLGRLALNVRFETPDGITALFGKSGAGKSSIVNAIAGLLRPDGGRIVLDGRVLQDSAQGIWVPPQSRRFGYVFQESRLFPHFSVERNLKFGARFAPESGLPLEEVAELLDIRDLLSRRPRHLSGGEKQRVAIGRALLSAPKMLLMDEPLASLDEARKAEILPYLERLRDEAGVPMLYVSHSVSEVARLATTLVALDAGQVAQVGPTREIMSNPEAVPVLGVRDAGAVLPAVVASHEDEDGLTRCRVSAGELFLPRISMPVGARVAIRIEAHDIMIALSKPDQISALNVLSAQVVSVVDGAGPGAAVALQVGEDRLLARVTRRSARLLGLVPGTDCFAIVKSTSVAHRDVTPDQHQGGPEDIIRGSHQSEIS